MEERTKETENELSGVSNMNFLTPLPGLFASQSGTIIFLLFYYTSLISLSNTSLKIGFVLRIESHL